MAAAAGAEAVRQPGRSRVLRHAGHRLPLVARIAARDLGIGVGVGQRGVPAARDAGRELGLQAAGLGFSDLQVVARVGGIGGLAVLLAHLVDGRIGRDAPALGLPFHAGFPLLAALGLERLAVEVHPAQGLERLRIAQVGRPAAIHLVGGAQALGPGAVVHGGCGAAFRVGFRPVVAQAERGRPAVPADLVLCVKAHLSLPHAGLACQFGFGRRREVAVHRCIDIDAAHGLEPRGLAGGVALRIHAEQQRVFGGSCAQPAFELRIDHQQAAGVALPGGIAQQRAVVRLEHRARRPARGAVGGEAGVHAAVIDVAHRAAQVLPQRPGAVQLVAEEVAPGIVLAVVGVPAGLADERRGRDLPVWAGQLRALPGEEADQRAALVFLVRELQRERRGGTGLPGQRGGEQLAVVAHVVHLGVAVAAHGHQAVEPLPVLRERAGQVGRDLLARVVAQLHLYLAQRLGLGALAREVEHAAHAALSVQHGRRPAQEFHAFEQVGIGLDVVVGAVGAQQAVQVLRHVAAAGLEAVHAAVEVVGHHARGIGRGLAQRLRALRLHLVAGDDADGLGRLDQRGIGLGGRQGPAGHEAGDGVHGVFLLAVGTHRHRGERGFRRRGRARSGGLLGMRGGCSAQGAERGGSRGQGLYERARRSIGARGRPAGEGRKVEGMRHVRQGRGPRAAAGGIRMVWEEEESGFRTGRRGARCGGESLRRGGRQGGRLHALGLGEGERGEVGRLAVLLAIALAGDRVGVLHLGHVLALPRQGEAHRAVRTGHGLAGPAGGRGQRHLGLGQRLAVEHHAHFARAARGHHIQRCRGSDGAGQVRDPARGGAPEQRGLAALAAVDHRIGSFREQRLGGAGQCVSEGGRGTPAFHPGGRSGARRMGLQHRHALELVQRARRFFDHVVGIFAELQPRLAVAGFEPHLVGLGTGSGAGGEEGGGPGAEGRWHRLAP